MNMRATVSVRDILYFVAICAVLAKLATCVGVTLASFGTLNASVYVGGLSVPPRMHRVAIVCCLVFSAAPWTGAAGLPVAYPGCGALPVLVREPRTQLGDTLLGILVKPVYNIASTPLEALAAASADAYGLICFPGTGVVRPFSVFYFWFSLSVTLIAAAARRRITMHIPWPSTQERSS